jgi:hypothetical protein
MNTSNNENQDTNSNQDTNDENNEELTFDDLYPQDDFDDEDRKYIFSKVRDDDDLDDFDSLKITKNKKSESKKSENKKMNLRQFYDLPSDKPKSWSSQRVDSKKPVKEVMIEHKRQFNPRLVPFKLIKKNIVSCIDTSDKHFPSLK